jgi:hypothetical protein
VVGGARAHLECLQFILVIPERASQLAAGVLAVLLAGGCGSVTVVVTDPVTDPVTDTVPGPALVAGYGSILAGLLAGVDARFGVRRAEVEEAATAAGGVTAGAAEALLTATEQDLRAALGEADRTSRAKPPETSPSAFWSGSSLDFYGTGNELAPLADWVTVRFADLRAELRRGSPDGRQRRAASGPASGSTAHRLASRPPATALARAGRPDFVPSAIAASVLDGVGSLIRHLLRRAEENRLTIDLCVRTAPLGAQVMVFPASYPRGARGGLSEHVFLRLFRGLYLYRIEHADGAKLDCPELPTSGRPPMCAPLDLMDDDREVWSCELGLGRDRTPGCRRLERSPGECAG